MTQGMSRQRSSLRIAVSTSNPLRCGIMRSSNTKEMSGSRSSASMASRPSYTSVTRNGPCSSFILMMRPMWGSSSATSTWHVGASLGRGRSTKSLDEGRDVFPVAPQLEEQLADVRARVEQNEQYGFGREHGDDSDAVTMLEDRGEQFSTARDRAEVSGADDDRRNTARDVLGVQTGAQLTVDQQAIASQHDGGVDSFTLPNGSDQITNARHSTSRAAFPAKSWRS